MAGAVSDLEDSFVSVPRLRGLAERVFALERAMDAAPRPAHAPVRGADEAGMIVANLAIRPPTARSGGGGDGSEEPLPPPLFTDLSFTLRPGEHTVIRGAGAEQY